MHYQSFKATPAVPVSQNLPASLKAALQHKSDMNLWEKHISILIA